MLSFIYLFCSNAARGQNGTTANFSKWDNMLNLNVLYNEQLESKFISFSTYQIAPPQEYLLPIKFGISTATTYDSILTTTVQGFSISLNFEELRSHVDKFKTAYSINNPKYRYSELDSLGEYKNINFKSRLDTGLTQNYWPNDSIVNNIDLKKDSVSPDTFGIDSILTEPPVNFQSDRDSIKSGLNNIRNQMPSSEKEMIDKQLGFLKSRIDNFDKLNESFLNRIDFLQLGTVTPESRSILYEGFKLVGLATKLKVDSRFALELGAGKFDPLQTYNGLFSSYQNIYKGKYKFDSFYSSLFCQLSPVSLLKLNSLISTSVKTFSNEPDAAADVFNGRNISISLEQLFYRKKIKLQTEIMSFSNDEEPLTSANWGYNVNFAGVFTNSSQLYLNFTRFSEGFNLIGIQNYIPEKTEFNISGNYSLKKLDIRPGIMFTKTGISSIYSEIYRPMLQIIYQPGISYKFIGDIAVLNTRTELTMFKQFSFLLGSEFFRRKKEGMFKVGSNIRVLQNVLALSDYTSEMYQVLINGKVEYSRSKKTIGFEYRNTYTLANINYWSNVRYSMILRFTKRRFQFTMYNSLLRPNVYADYFGLIEVRTSYSPTDNINFSVEYNSSVINSNAIDITNRVMLISHLKF